MCQLILCVLFLDPNMLIYHFVPMIFFYIPFTFLVEPVIIYKSSYVLLVAETSCCSIQLYVLNVCVFLQRFLSCFNLYCLIIVIHLNIIFLFLNKKIINTCLFVFVFNCLYFLGLSCYFHPYVQGYCFTIALYKHNILCFQDYTFSPHQLCVKKGFNMLYVRCYKYLKYKFCWF